MRPAFLLLALLSCSTPTPSPTPTPTPTPTPSAPPPSPPPEPVHLEELSIPDDLPAWVLRGAKAHEARFVFVPGMCVHPLGYAQSFQNAAAAHGDLVTLQGDVPCGGPYRKWSHDIPTIARRIDAVLATAGVESRELTLIGYSQGAEIAERLAARYPAKFTRVVLIASPISPSVERLAKVDAAVMMAGARDRQDNMREGARLLAQAHIPSTFQVIPGARHGDMGASPDDTMAVAFGWLAANARGAVTQKPLLR